MSWLETDSEMFHLKLRINASHNQNWVFCVLNIYKEHSNLSCSWCCVPQQAGNWRINFVIKHFWIEASGAQGWWFANFKAKGLAAYCAQTNSGAYIYSGMVRALSLCCEVHHHARIIYKSGGWKRLLALAEIHLASVWLVGMGITYKLLFQQDSGVGGGGSALWLH
jgi:hypothetical protein